MDEAETKVDNVVLLFPDVKFPGKTEEELDAAYKLWHERLDEKKKQWQLARGVVPDHNQVPQGRRGIVQGIKALIKMMTRV